MTKPDLKSKQEQALLLLVSGKTITDTARDVEIDRSTIYNWFYLKDFQVEYNKLRLELKERARNNLLSMLDEAISSLREIFKGTNEALKFKTAIFILQSALNNEPMEKLTNEFDRAWW